MWKPRPRKTAWKVIFWQRRLNIFICCSRREGHWTLTKWYSIRKRIRSGTHGQIRIKIFRVESCYRRLAHIIAFGTGPYSSSEKRDKRTPGRKKRLGGPFPGKRHSRCPFISPTILLLRKAHLLPASAPLFTYRPKHSARRSCQLPSAYSYCKTKTKHGWA